MTPHWADLCKLPNSKYRAKWLAQRDNPPTLHQKPPPPHWLTCEHRGKSTATISGRTAGTGCAASRVDVYWCNFFKQPVLKKSPARCRDKVAEQVDGYTGRTCSECQIPRKKIVVLHITHRSEWQDANRRSTFALQQHGLDVQYAELVKPTETRLQEAWSKYNPQIVVNHALAVPTKTLLKVFGKHRNTTVISVDHSNQNHTFTWPHYFGEWRQVLEATKKYHNFWCASPDFYMPWNDLGFERYVHWPNPVLLPPRPELPSRIGVERLVIVGRTDWMKAFPAQIAAAALVQRKRKNRVALVLNGDQARKNGLYEHAKACGLYLETPDWMDMPTWEAYLRDQVAVVCQSSFSESFNYVSMEAAGFGRPFVGARSIRHTPEAWRVENPNDCYEIAAKIEHILDDYPASSRLAREVAEQVAERNNRTYAELVRRLIHVDTNHKHR